MTITEKNREAQMAESWDRVYREYPLEQLPWEEGSPSAELIALVEGNQIEPGAVLDICSGSGTNAVYLAQHGFTCTGIDISPTAVAYAKEKAQQAGVSCDFRPANAAHLPHPDGSFSLVFDRGCFHHIPPQDREAFIRGVHRVLNIGGKYQLICFSHRDKQAPQSFSPQDIRRYFSPWFHIIKISEATFRERRGFQRQFLSVLMEKRASEGTGNGEQGR